MAETVFIRGEGGGVIEMSLPLHEAIADRLTKGYLRVVNADGTELDDVKELTRPLVTARKIEWIAYAVHNGEKPDDAEAYTKQDLIEKYGV